VDLTPKEKVKKFGIFWAALLVGAALAFCYPEHCPFARTVHKLGDAFFIAGIIGLIIETFSAGLIAREASDAIADRLVGPGLPAKAQQVIRAFGQEQLVYLNYRKRYNIHEDGEQAGGMVRVVVDVEYTVVNNGTSRYPEYRPTLQEEGIHNPRVLRLEFGKHIYAEGDIQAEVFEATKVHTFRPPDAAAIKHLRPTKPGDDLTLLGDDVKCDVRWRYEIITPRFYSDVTCFGGITIAPSIQYEHIPEGFRFAAHSGESVLGEECEHAENSLVWHHTRAFMRGQHIRAWWWPSEASHDSSSDVHQT